MGTRTQPIEKGIAQTMSEHPHVDTRVCRRRGDAAGRQDDGRGRLNDAEADAFEPRRARVGGEQKQRRARESTHACTHTRAENRVQHVREQTPAPVRAWRSYLTETRAAGSARARQVCKRQGVRSARMLTSVGARGSRGLESNVVDAVVAPPSCCPGRARRWAPQCFHGWSVATRSCILPAARSFARIFQVLKRRCSAQSELWRGRK